MAKITYFDFSNVYYSSFFLNGFLANARERGYHFAVSHRLPAELAEPGANGLWPYTRGEEKISVYRYESGGKSSLFCLDGSNLNGEQVVDGFSGLSELLLQRCDHYFKVNYNEDVIANNPRFTPYADKIKPLPIVWPVAPPQKWRFLPRLWPIAENWPKARRRWRWFRRMHTLDYFRDLRDSETEIDVLFVNIYRHPEEKHRKEHQERLAIIKELKKRAGLNLVVGFNNAAGDVPGEYAEHKVPFMRYDEYLSLLAKSRVGLYVRGSFGCLSTKFGEQMALGKAIVGESLLNNRQNMYRYDRFDEQFTYDDPYEMAERIVDLLGNPGEIAELERVNTETYERYLTPKPVVAGLLDELENS